MLESLLNTYAQDLRLNGLREDGSSLKVLVIDDSKTMRRDLSKIFESVGYECYTAENLSLGIEA